MAPEGLFEDLVSLLHRVGGSTERARAFAELLAERLPLRYCAVALGSNDRLSIAHAAGNDEAAALARRDFERAPAFNGLATAAPQQIESTLFVPLSGGSGLHGLVFLEPGEGNVTEETRRQVQGCAAILSLALENSNLADEVERLVERSTDDRLTGAHNRRGFDERLRTDWKRAMRDGSSIALALVDVDHFTAFDESYGRPRGDDCLKQVARAIAAAGLRSGDYIARFGAQEFAVIMPGADEDGALALCDRIRSFVALRNIEHAPSPFGIVTVSIGVAATTPQQNPTHWSLIGRADANLQRACHAGRNRVAGGNAMRTSPLPSARGSLPPLPHPFTGRARELEETSSLEDRWLTIVGLQGIGKTALALQLAGHNGTAAFVELDGATGDEVAERIGDAVRNGRHDDHLTVVLDRCSPAIAAVAEYVTRGRDASLLRTIATSAEPLGVTGERVYELGPLDAADAKAFLKLCAPQASPDIADVCERSPFEIEVAAAILHGKHLSSYTRWVRTDAAAERTVGLATRLGIRPVAAHAAHYSGDAETFEKLMRGDDRFEAAFACIYGANYACGSDDALQQLDSQCEVELARVRAAHYDLALELELARAQINFRLERRDAKRRAERVVRTIRTGSAPYLASSAFLVAAHAELAARAVDDALSLLLDASRRAREVPFAASIANVLDGYVYAAAVADRLDMAAQLHAFVTEFRSVNARPRAPFPSEHYWTIAGRYGLPEKPPAPDLTGTSEAFSLARTI